MPRARRRRRKPHWPRRIAAALLAVPALYLLAALAGSLIPVNRDWTEPDSGITIYLASNGIHADIVMPRRAAGLDWGSVLSPSDAAAADPRAAFVAFGSGEEKVFLDTPRWRDITPATLWSALTGGRRIMHVHWAASPGFASRAIRLRPDEYRRLWAAVRADFERGEDGAIAPVDHPGYGCCDAFYPATGRFTALRTCNNWAADRLRIAGVKTSLWPPIVQGLTWRYRKAGHNT